MTASAFISSAMAVSKRLSGLEASSRGVKGRFSYERVSLLFDHGGRASELSANLLEILGNDEKLEEQEVTASNRARCDLRDQLSWRVIGGGRKIGANSAQILRWDGQRFRSAFSLEGIETSPPVPLPGILGLLQTALAQLLWPEKNKKGKHVVRACPKTRVVPRLVCRLTVPRRLAQGDSGSTPVRLLQQAVYEYFH